MNSGVFPDGVGPYFSPYSVIQLRIPIDVAQQTELEMESSEFQFNIFCVFVWGGGFFPKLLCVFVKAWLFPHLYRPPEFPGLFCHLRSVECGRAGQSVSE